MNKITLEIEIEDEQLLETLYTTINVEMEATKTERGEAETHREENTLKVVITAQDHVAARAITNSIMRLMKTSVDVAESITITKSKE